MTMLAPERDVQFRTLETLLTSDTAPVSNLVVWGRHGADKASTIKALLEGSKRRYAWVLCCLTDSMEDVMTSVATQLHRDNTPAPPRRFVTPTRLLHYLSELCPVDEPPCYLAMESPERLAPPLVEMLIKAEERPEIHLCTIFLAQSCEGWLPNGSTPPLAIAIDGYSTNEMTSIIERELLPFNAHDDVSRDFIRSVVPSLMRCTVDVSTIKRTLRYLFIKFWEASPAEQGEALNVPELNRQIMPYVASVLKCINTGHISDLKAALRRMESQKKTGKTQSIFQPGLHSTGLPIYSKIMLLGSFICSHNRPMYDQILFDPNHTTKRRRRTTIASKPDKKRMSPIAFDYERLFMTAHRLMQAVDPDEDLSGMYTSVYASQFVTLESFGFIKRVGDRLKAAKYTCSIDKEFATQLAEALKLNLPDYLETPTV